MNFKALIATLFSDMNNAAKKQTLTRVSTLIPNSPFCLGIDTVEGYLQINDPPDWLVN